MAQAIEEKKSKRGVVHNKLFGKIVRTLGFAMLSVGLAIVAVTTIIALRDALGSSADSYDQYVTVMETTLNKLGIPNIVFYGLFMTLVGVLLVILAVGKTWFGKILHIITFVFITLYLIFSPGNSVLLLTGVNQEPEFIKTFATANMETFNLFDQLIKAYPKMMGGIVTALYVIITLNVLSNKKPKRFSLSFIKFGFGLITFMVFSHGIIMPILGGVSEFILDFMQSRTYLIFVYGSLTISYLFQLLGSIIGTIFFFVR